MTTHAHLERQVLRTLTLTLTLTLSPEQVMENLAKEKGLVGRGAPFATVCTDLGSAHPSWFDRRVDLCFVASEAVRTSAVEAASSKWRGSRW